MKKKILTLLLAVILAFSLSACSVIGNMALELINNIDSSSEPTLSVEYGEEYTSRDEVALYLYQFNELPSNFITKNEAKSLGWPGGDLWKYAPGKSIGGSVFGNYEGLLPEGSYHECDINYQGGNRGAERLVYSDDAIYYTGDHYESFEQLYP